MYSSFSFGSFARARGGGQTAEVQRLVESSSTTLEEVLRFPNIVSELQGSIDSRAFFTTQKVEHLIKLVFDAQTLAKYSFDDARKFAFAASELLSTKVGSINEFFFHQTTDAKLKRSGILIEDGDTEPMEFDPANKEMLLLSPANSVKSKSATTIESYNKTALDFLFAKALSDPVLDETRAGYLNKIIVSFFQKYRNELLNYFYKSGFDFKRFVLYMEDFAIADLIVNITLFESSLGNDSMVFHESQTQVSNDHTKSRLELLRGVLSNPLMASNKEVAANTRFVLEEYFNKYKNINETDLIFADLFGNDRLLTLWIEYIEAGCNEGIETELIGLFRALARLLSTASTAKGETLSEVVKSLLSENSELATKLPLYFARLFKHFRNKRATKNAPREKDQLSWINGFKIESQSCLRSRFAFVETCLFFTRQKFISFVNEMHTTEFFDYLLVGLIDSTHCF